MVVELGFGSAGTERGPFVLVNGDFAFHNLILEDGYTVSSALDGEVTLCERV